MANVNPPFTHVGGKINLPPRIRSVIKKLFLFLHGKIKAQSCSSKMEVSEPKEGDTATSTIKECKSEARKESPNPNNQPANEDAETSRCVPYLSPELIQRKYKCFIIYAISIVSMIELVMLLFNSDQSSSKNIMDVLARYVNRTQNVI